MRVLSIGIQSILVILIVIYTVNFGRWLWSRKMKTGAYGAYGVAAVALAVSAFAIYLHYE